jgi:hypothetical protein
MLLNWAKEAEAMTDAEEGVGVAEAIPREAP